VDGNTHGGFKDSGLTLGLGLGVFEETLLILAVTVPLQGVPKEVIIKNAIRFFLVLAGLLSAVWPWLYFRELRLVIEPLSFFKNDIF